MSELNEGACLFSFNKEELKVASFNDKTSFITTLRLLDQTNLELINSNLSLNKKTNYKSLSYALHCSSVGASIIMRSKIEDQSFCSWLHVKEGKLQARSVGLILDDKNERLDCDGVIPLEFIVGLKNAASDDFLSEFSSMIDHKVPIGKSMMKIVLKREFLGKETSFMDELRKSSEVRFIELNSYQHPIGDLVEIK